MTCRYCETVNAEGWTRCRKCDAPLGAPVIQPRSSRRRAAATAPLAEIPARSPQAGPGQATPAQPAPFHPRPAFQQSLFRGEETAKVISIRPGAESRPRAGRGSGQRATVSGAPRYRQQELRLADTATAARLHVGEGVVSCNAPVAGVTHRVLAFAADLALVAIASGGVFLGLVFWGGVPLAGKQGMLFGAAGFLLVWVLYQLLWCAANLDSPGMNWARLRLLDFSGFRPARRQRFIRLAVFCLGTLAVGLGQAWALVDEEGLTWQDHVSETFPTPY